MFCYIWKYSRRIYMNKLILASALIGATFLTGCANMQQITEQSQQPVQTQTQEPLVRKPVQDKKTDYAIYGPHRGEKPLVVFQGIIMNIQPYKEDKSTTVKGINGFLAKLDPTLKLNDPTAKSMMDITIGTANKQQFHYKQVMDPAFAKGRIILVVQFENGDTVLDPEVNKAEFR